MNTKTLIFSGLLASLALPMSAQANEELREVFRVAVDGARANGDTVGCGDRVVEKPDNRDACAAISEAAQERAEQNFVTQYEIQNPYLSGCDLSIFQIPGLPTFDPNIGIGFGAGALCDIVQDVIDESVIGDINNSVNDAVNGAVSVIRDSESTIDEKIAVGDTPVIEVEGGLLK